MRYFSPVHPRAIPRPLCWGGGSPSRTLKPPRQKLTPNLNISDSMSCSEWAAEKSHSLKFPMGGQRKTDGEGERKNTGGYYRSSSIHTSCGSPEWSSGVSQQTPEDHSIFLLLVQSFSVCSSHNFTKILKRKSIYHSAKMRKWLNRWKTSTQDHHQHVKWSGFQWWQMFSSTIVRVYWEDSHALVVKPSYSPCELCHPQLTSTVKYNVPFVLSVSHLCPCVFTDSWIWNKNQ